ncbi:MAG: hypothetical protein QOG84_2842 [Sphingomonadales bacterium]|jgi:hypothetical protein|nr:hypothetical protein [Sphingomonadales bacterium]
MARRIEVTPSSDGTLNLICGDEMLELVIVPAHPPSPGKSAWRHVDTGTRYVLAMPDIVSEMDVESLAKSVIDQHRDPGTPQFEGLVLQAPSVNVHGVARLARRLREALPGLGLAVDLRPDL